ncbi:MAG: ribonuclease E/G, partial [Agathobacter sp.]|nr:ribonuclease E/G [Agathobacter sp.]
MNRLIITEIEHNHKNYCAYLVMDEHRRLLDVQLFEPQDETLLDHIYVGFVEKIVPNIQAAFVRIAGGQK